MGANKRSPSKAGFLQASFFLMNTASQEDAAGGAPYVESVDVTGLSAAMWAAAHQLQICGCPHIEANAQQLGQPLCWHAQ